MLFGFTGSKMDASFVFKKIKIAISKEIQGETDLKKSGIQHRSDGVIFLGYQFLGKYNDKLHWCCKQICIYNCMTFSLPIKRLVKKYVEKGFLQASSKNKTRKCVARRVDK